MRAKNRRGGFLKPPPPPPGSYRVKEVNSNESRETLQDGDSASKQDPKLITDVPPKISNCIFYLQGRCRHGRLGKDCNYVHPPMCHKFIKNGDKSCKKGSDCKYVHPKLCLRSLSTKECLKPTCSFYHVAGTRRNSDNIQAPQKLMSINTAMPVNTNVPAFSRPAPQHHPNTQPTPSNVTSTRPSPNPSTSNPSYLNATPSPLPGFKSSPTLPNSTTHQSTTNYLLPPTDLPSCSTQTNQPVTVPTTSALNSDSSIFLGQLWDLRFQLSQMMETQNYLLKVVMKQEWPPIPKSSHIF